MADDVVSDYRKAKMRLLLPRVILGSIFVFSGLNGLFNMYTVAQYSPEGERFIALLKAYSWPWYLLKSAELVGGSLLVFSTGPLGFLILGPITAAIFAFHAFLSPQGSMLGFAVVALELVLAAMWWRNLRRIFYHRQHEPSREFKRRHPEIHDGPSSSHA